ncbi:hypothetical protein HDU86_005202 [Geranomyces michiganensis]|nr:hypothetical protein HDU86_005202 [Geranomyces michiganensis]
MRLSLLFASLLPAVFAQTTTPAEPPQFVLSSSGDNILQAEERVVCAFDPEVSFVFHSDGAIALEDHGKTWGGRLQVVDAGIQTAGLYLQGDGSLVVMDMENSAIPITPGTGLANSPFVLSVDIDRRARIRDASDEITYEFPPLRTPQIALNSARMNFLRSGEILKSANGKYQLSITRQGVLRSNMGIQFNNVPGSSGYEPRALLLRPEGKLVLLDSAGNTKWSSTNVQGPNPALPYVAEISDSGFLRILDGNADLVWNWNLDVPPPQTKPPPTPTAITPPPLPPTTTVAPPPPTKSTTTPPKPSSTPTPPPPKQICMPMNQVKDECVILGRTHSVTAFGTFPAKTPQAVKDKWWWLNCNCFAAWVNNKADPWGSMGSLTAAQITLYNKEQCNCKIAQTYYGITGPNSVGTAPVNIKNHWVLDKCTPMKYCYNA